MPGPLVLMSNIILPLPSLLKKALLPGEGARQSSVEPWGQKSQEGAFAVTSREREGRAMFWRKGLWSRCCCRNEAGGQETDAVALALQRWPLGLHYGVQDSTEPS